jgi:hypothetical protein
MDQWERMKMFYFMDQWERMEMFYFILLLFCFLGEDIWKEEGEKREERED